LKLTENNHGVTDDFLSNQYASSIYTSLKHKKVKRTKLKENDQPLNPNSSTNLLSTTLSPQLGGLSDQNLQGVFQFNFIMISCMHIFPFSRLINIHSFFFTTPYANLSIDVERKPLNEITHFNLNNITTTATNGLTAPSRKRGRPNKKQSFAQTNVPPVTELPEQNFQKLHVLQTQCKLKTQFQRCEASTSYVPLSSFPTIAPPLRKLGRPKKYPPLSEAQVNTFITQSSQQKPTTLDVVDKETVNCQQLKSSQGNLSVFTPPFHFSLFF
jgi:hypothetical protein